MSPAGAGRAPPPSSDDRREAGRAAAGAKGGPRPRAARPPDLSVEIAGVRLPNPVLAASGCFGFGRELASFVALDQVGAVVTKSVSLRPRPGLPTPRMAETPGGMLNAIGLQNPGVEAYRTRELPALAEAGARVVASIFGETPEGFAAVAERLAGEPAVQLLEVNLSCPNVEERGQVYAADPRGAAGVIRAVKARAGQPVLAKLTADVTDVTAVARACVDAGADGLVCVNTLLGMAVDVPSRRPKLAAVTGGLSGPAIRPVAVRCAWQVASALPGVPVVGSGGILTAEDAAEFLLVGALAVEVGTGNFVNPRATLDVAAGLGELLAADGLGSIAELTASFKEA